MFVTMSCINSISCVSQEHLDRKHVVNICTEDDTTADNVLHDFRDNTGQADRSVQHRYFWPFLNADTTFPRRQSHGMLPSFKDF